ncbi:MAG TPA: MFS transporter [Chthoniobacterales bacterium]|nr:MFS transporter [Chthoniobacterales bacterium]
MSKDHFLTKALGGVHAPLRNPIFRNLWIANFLSNLGMIMHAVAAAWFMTSLTTSPLLVGLVQTAVNLPILLLGIPCGALSDLFDRRKLLIIAQWWMLSAAVLMAFFAALGRLSPGGLLALLFLLGIGTALHLPSWMALLQDLVIEEHVPAAVSLNSIGFNLARTLGPALGGFCVNLFGVSLVFFGNALSYLAVLFGLWRIPASLLPPPPSEKVTFKALFHSLREAWSFLVKSRQLPGVLLRMSLFMVAGSGFWGVLPLLARDSLHLSASGYGGLLSAFGIGSVLGALFLPKLRDTISIDAIVATGILLFVGCLLLLAYSQKVMVVSFAMGVCGVAWIWVIVNYNVAIQLSAPAWIKGRMISLYVVIFQGGIGLGSAWTGWLANYVGCQTSLTLGAFLVLAGLLLIPIFPLRERN